jgi:hypothetical protein
LLMGFVCRDFTAEETERFASYGLRDPFWERKPAEGSWGTVDGQTGAMLVPFSRQRDYPSLEYYAFLMDGQVIWMAAQAYRKWRYGEPDEVTLHEIDEAWPADSPLWGVPGIMRMIKEALTVTDQDAFQYRDVTPPVRFDGEFGDQLEQA